MQPQWRDLISNYQPEVFWLDGDWTANSDEWGTKELLAWTYSDSPVGDRIVVDDRMGTDTSRTHGDFYTVPATQIVSPAGTLSHLAAVLTEHFSPSFLAARSPSTAPTCTPTRSGRPTWASTCTRTV